jgi:hypothetical protein
MRIFVSGGLLPDNPVHAEAARALGRAIIAGGHQLLQGYYNAFDHQIAQAAYQAATGDSRFPDPRLAVQSFLTRETTRPADAHWLLRRMQIRDWDPGEERWAVPEPLQQCDVLILMGGGPKSLRAANLARMAGKPIAPVTALGGAAIEVFATELARFDIAYKGRIDRDQFLLLDAQCPNDLDALATEVVKVATRLAVGSSVFVVMAFRKELEDTLSSIEDVCRDLKLTLSRTDLDPSTDRIYQRIVDGIRRAAVVIADVTVPSLNVYYELGFAEAIGKPVIVVAKMGTDLPFDTKDIPTILFPSQKELKAVLGSRVAYVLGINEPP